MSNKIISLCYVNQRNGTADLYRIADYDGGVFRPFVQKANTSFDWSNSAILHASSTVVLAASGTIRCFEWSPYAIDHQRMCLDIRESNLSWIEIIQMNCATPKTFLEQLRHGWNPPHGYDGKHDVVFCLKQAKNDRVSALYIPRNAFELKTGKWYIIDGYSTLVYGTIDNNDTFSCACRYSRTDKRRYLRSIDRFNPEAKITTENTEVRKESINSKAIKQVQIITSENSEKNSDTIIAEIIHSTISIMPISAEERQLVQNTLGIIDNTYVLEKIMEKLNCPEEEAQQYLHEFLATRKYRLEHDEAVGIMEKLIAIDSNYVAILRGKIQNQWEQEQADRLRAAQQEVDGKKEELQEIKTQVNEETHKIEEIIRRQ